MSEGPTCSWCGEALVQRPGEQRNKFAQRATCGKEECVKMAKRGRLNVRDMPSQRH